MNFSKIKKTLIRKLLDKTINFGESLLFLLFLKNKKNKLPYNMNKLELIVR
jgi:hypothetical protein